MQVFLPYPDIKQSLRALDGSRLRKQRVEAFQLLNAILQRPTASGKPKAGWTQHPAAVMFRQYVPFLQEYYNQSLVVNAERGGNNIKLVPEEITDEIVKPFWFGDDTVHATHRSRLLFKGKIDVLADRIKQYTGCSSVNRYLKERNYPELNAVRQPEYDIFTKWLDDVGAPQSSLTNHYSQFNWTESDQLEYLWPAEFPGEPHRRVR